MSINRKVNVIDLIFLVSIIFGISGFLLVRAEKTSLNKIIKGKEKIAIEVFLPDVFLESQNTRNSIFTIGEKTAITIRNRPYTNLPVIKKEIKPKLAIIEDKLGTYKTIIDPTKVNISDFFITLSDIALRTDDGYVIGGNKIKIGNQIELEGFNYRLPGKVINIYPLNE